jgi:hypothetical protein
LYWQTRRTSLVLTNLSYLSTRAFTWSWPRPGLHQATTSILLAPQDHWRCSVAETCTKQDQIYATVTPQHSNRAAGLDLAAWAIVFRPASKEDACAGSSRSIVASRQSALQNGIDGARKFDACAETTTREDQDPR